MKAILVLIATLVVSFVAVDTEARRGIGIVNTGENVIHISDIKTEMRTEVEAETAPGVAVGVLYNRFGLFWLDIWRWNKRYVLFNEADDSVWELPEEALSNIAANGLSKPFTMTVPPGLMVLLAAGMGFGALMLLGRGKEEEAEETGDASAAPDVDTTA